MRRRDPHDEALEMLRSRAREGMTGHDEPDGDEGTRVTIIIGGEEPDEMDDEEQDDDLSAY